MGRLEGSGPRPETHLSQGHLQGSQAHLESGLPGQPVIIDPSSIYLEGDGRTNPVTLRTAPERPLALFPWRSPIADSPVPALHPPPYPAIPLSQEQASAWAGARRAAGALAWS